MDVQLSYVYVPVYVPHDVRRDKDDPGLEVG